MDYDSIYLHCINTIDQNTVGTFTYKLQHVEWIHNYNLLINEYI